MSGDLFGIVLVVFVVLCVLAILLHNWHSKEDDQWPL